ncbi:ubinuclein-2-like protein [Fragilaria crotonensis]|nr:ubinuclein-2-like protein [Fragilaria crotonensis]
MKSPPLTLTASASLRATAIMLESPTPTPNSSNAPFVVEAITPFYAASYQRFDADIRRAELNDEALPPFAELESHLLNIDESRGLTLPSQNQRNYNQHAHSTPPSFAHIQTLMATIKTEVIHQDHRKTIRARSDHLQLLRDHPSTIQINDAHHLLHRARPTNTNETTAPPFRPTSNPNQRPSPNGSNINQSRNSASNAATIVCNNCGRLGHYSRNCTNPRQNNRASNPQRSTNNENAAPRNQQRAYFVTDSSQDSQNHSRYHHQAFKASSLDHLDDQPDYIPWPNPNLPQMTINQPLLDRDYLPTANHAPPNSGATAYFPDDPQSPYQRFGPPLLANWLPDSGATSHYTPLFSDLSDVEPCSVPISLADGSTKIVLIKNRATTIQLPNGSTYTWPIITREVPNPHQAFSTTSNPKEPFDLDSEPEEQHFDDTTTPIDTDQRRSITALPLELIYRRLAYRNFRNLMVGSLHQTWNDHVLTPTVDHNSWPLRISISQKRARNKTPQRQGTEPFHRLHLDLMRNPFRYGLTTNSNYSAYLFIVTTPGKLTGWIGLPTESTTSILIALKQWLTDTELLGRTQSVRFIRTDAGSAFTSTKFISECTSLGIKVEAAAPEHQEMNGICEAKWREVHNTANILLNNARLENVIDQDGNPTTPYQYSFQRKPSIANFRVFGCPTFFKRYEPTFRNKLITYKQQLQRASRGIFLGFPDNSAGWLVYSQTNPKASSSPAMPTLMKTSIQLYVLIPNPLLEPSPSAPISTQMDFATLLKTLNHLLFTKLDLQPTLAIHHQPSLMTQIHCPP